MNEFNVFVSVGATATEQQESFVRAVEERLRSEGLIPHSIGRNSFSADAPLKAVLKLMDDCVGTVIIALERMYFSAGTEMRGGPKEASLTETKLATPWNQIEGAIAHSRGYPLLVIIESGIRSEGLLENGYDWYVQRVKLEGSALNTNEFNGVLASWKQKIIQLPRKPVRDTAVTDLTVAELLGSLKPSQLWSLLVALAALVAGAFALGGQLFGKTPLPPLTTRPVTQQRWAPTIPMLSGPAKRSSETRLV
jgi:hypothetical protein